MITKKRLFIFSFIILLFLYLFNSGLNTMHSDFENQIKFVLKDIEKKTENSENPLYISYDNINCNGFYHLSCVINNLNVKDDLGGVLSSNYLYIYNLKGFFPLYNTYNKKSSQFNFGIKINNLKLFPVRKQYSISEMFYNKIINPSTIDMNISYFINKNNSLESLNVNYFNIYNDFYHIHSYLFLVKSNILKHIFVDINLKNYFSYIMYHKFYLGLSNSSYKIMNKQLFNINRETPLSYEEYKKYKHLFANDLNSFVSKEPIFQIKILNPLIEKVKNILNDNEKDIRISFYNDMNITLNDFRVKLEDYLFGTSDIDINAENIFGYKININRMN